MSRWRSSLAPALAAWGWCVWSGAALGVLIALANVARDALENRYVEIGFWNTIADAASRRAIGGAAVGVVFGAQLGLLCCAQREPLSRALSLSGLRRGLAWLFEERLRAAIAVAFVVAAWLAPTAFRSQLPPERAYAMSLAASIGVVAFAVATRATTRAGIWRAIGVATFAAVPLAIAWRKPASLERNARLDAWALDALWIAVALAAFVIASRARSAPSRRSAAKLAAALAALALVIAASIAGASAARPIAVERPWNVLVIGVDTLRADRTCLSPEGFERDVTPNLRRIAERGVRFTTAISQASWTTPAFSSILTGKYPHQHGALSLSGRLRPSETTLAEVLREAGYATCGVVSGSSVDRKHGIHQGFDEYREDHVSSARAVSSREVADLAIEFVERNVDRPFFLFAHLFDPHWEYLEHRDWPWSDEYAGWLREQNRYEDMQRLRELIGEDDLRWLRDRYDEEIAWTDRAVGRLLDRLDELGLADRTMIVLVADHGEEFLEHASLGHGHSLYDELLRVPLVAALPDRTRAGEAVERPVETRAVFDTVLSALGVDYGMAARAPGAATRSNDLFGAPAPDAAPPAAFSSLWLADSKPGRGVRICLWSLRTDRWKLIFDQTRGRELLFDLATDPGEQQDLSASSPPELATLRQRLQQWMAAMQGELDVVPLRTIGEVEAAELRALGYF